MSIVKLYGGLGNQMFQYAFGKELQFNKNTPVGFDKSWYLKDTNTDRPFGLDYFETKIPIFSIKYPRIIHEKIWKINNPLYDNVTYMGYWQSPLYFKNVEAEIKSHFELKPQFYTPEFLQLKKQIQDTNSVSIHIRRGDYLNHPNHLVLPIEYYLKSINIIKQFRSNTEFFIFSDDIPWCREHIKMGNYVEIGQNYLELELMKLCKHNIIANSTFSWWAAFLNSNPNKIIIAPARWAKQDEDQRVILQKRLLPADWLKIW